MLTAKQVATLDDGSDGRFLFGIGAGWNEAESRILGGDFEHRWSQVKEAVAVMKRCWTEDAPEYHGRYYDFPPVRCHPKPAQRPHPPIYLGSILFGDQWARRVFKRIVEWGDGWLPVIREVQQLIDGRAQLHALCAEAGRDPASIRITVFGAWDQWRQRREVDMLAAAGAEHVIIWLLARTSDDMRREMDALSNELLSR
jgi:alkanesulfonate monooxygenase SsuD/methylene tetrahydromethanopterin reductase-like flavin-dependent oxidoreductase (luciferase family)